MLNTKKISDSTVMERWEEFAAQVYPSGMGDRQRSQLRACFFAAYYDSILMVAELSERSDKDGFPMQPRVDAIVDECMKFAETEYASMLALESAEVN